MMKLLCGNNRIIQARMPFLEHAVEKCSFCSAITSENQMAAWSKISGYHPQAGYTKRRYIGTHGDQSTHKLIPQYTQHQGWLCSKCMKSLSAYKIEKFTDLRPSQKKGRKAITIKFVGCFSLAVLLCKQNAHGVRQKWACLWMKELMEYARSMQQYC